MVTLWQIAKGKINNNFRDKHELITYLGGNGGDTCQMTAFYYYGLFIFGQPDLLHFILDFHKIMPQSGVFIRHPDRYPKWNDPGQRDIARWNDPSVLSRDQLMPMCIALGIYDINSHLQKTLSGIIENGFRAPNGDLVFLSHFSACFIRAQKKKWLYPVLLFTDLFLILSSFIDVIKAKSNPMSGKGYKNAFMLLSQAYEVMPTPFSWLARKIYKFRKGGFIAGYQRAYSAADDPPFPEFFGEYISKLFN